MGAYLTECKTKASDLYDDTMNCLYKYAQDYELIRPNNQDNIQNTDIKPVDDNELNNMARKDELEDQYQLGNFEKKDD